jgi:hypothetical protein
MLASELNLEAFSFVSRKHIISQERNAWVLHFAYIFCFAENANSVQDDRGLWMSFISVVILRREAFR